MSGIHGGAAVVPPLPPSPDGGADDGALRTLDGELGLYANQIARKAVRGVQRGSARDDFEIVESEALDSVLGKTVPTLVSFLKYYDELAPGGPDRTDIVEIVYDLIRMKNSPRIASPVLLNRMEEELNHLKETGILRYDGFPAIDKPESDFETLVYNAFTMHVNKRNAMMYEGDEDIGFEYLENKFKVFMIESDVQVVPAPVAPAPDLSVRPGETTPPRGPTGAVPMLTPASASQPVLSPRSPARTISRVSAADSEEVTLDPTLAAAAARAAAAMYSASSPSSRSRSSSTGGNRRKTYRLKKKPSK
jgi:hypothetical protein